MENNELVQKKKWYNQTVFVVIWLVFFAPVGIYGLWKSNRIKKGWKIAWTIIIPLWMVFFYSQKPPIETTSSLPEVTKTEQTTMEPKKNQAEIDEKLLKKINTELGSFKDLDLSTFRESVESLQLELVLFNSWYKYIEEAEASTNIDVKKAGNKLKTETIKLQKKEFPILRKEYHKIVKSTLWKNDIEVNIKGPNYTTLEFIGSTFVTNANKQSTQETLSSILRLFRFKKTTYSYYEGSEYTYYTMDTPADDELVTALD